MWGLLGVFYWRIRGVHVCLDRLLIEYNKRAEDANKTVVVRFWGWTENAREVEMDMKEMIQKVKEKKPLYGESELTPYMQGVAARNSRYSQLAFGVMPWFNFANHNQHGVDTAKYYKAAEKELEDGRK